MVENQVHFSGNNVPSNIFSVPLVVVVARALLVCIALTWAPASAQSQPESTVTISVTNVTTHEGFIMAAIYDESGWGEASVANLREPARSDVVTITLAVPNPGKYGIRLFHDVDGNGELNANIMGIPTEPFGFSNDAPLRFGPPSFEAAAFYIDEKGAAHTISLQ